MHNIEEIQIIQECLKGTQSAFKTLYNLYRGYVYTICVRYGVREIEIKDCMQVVFMEVFKSLPKFDSNQAKFKTWMSRVTINQILTYNKKAKNGTYHLEDEKLDLIESDFITPIESLLDEKILFEILNKMPFKFCTVFNLFIIDGFSHAEIAEKLNITKGASRILLHRGRVWAMKELKVYMKDFITPTKMAKNN